MKAATAIAAAAMAVAACTSRPPVYEPVVVRCPAVKVVAMCGVPAVPETLMPGDVRPMVSDYIEALACRDDALAAWERAWEACAAP